MKPTDEEICSVLAGIISSCIYGPSGDPIDENLYPALAAWLLLERIDPNHKGLTSDLRKILAGENICEFNFFTGRDIK